MLVPVFTRGARLIYNPQADSLTTKSNRPMCIIFVLMIVNCFVLWVTDETFQSALSNYNVRNVSGVASYGTLGHVPHSVYTLFCNFSPCLPAAPTQGNCNYTYLIQLTTARGTAFIQCAHVYCCYFYFAISYHVAPMAVYEI
jgi:hypothetical protein